LYTALARGDEDTLKDIACVSILAEYRIQIARRKPGETVHWKLVKYVGLPPRIVSHKCGQMGMDFGGLPLGIQQVVVKMQSIQQMKTVISGRKVDRLGRTTAKEEAVKEEEEDIDWSGAKEKTVTEYIVIQRRLLKGVMEDWRVWGFAKEFDVATLNEKDEAEAEKAKKRTADTGKRVEGERANKQKSIAEAYS
jgi:protein MBA1